MKKSAFLTIMMLAACGGFGWRQHLRADAARQRQMALEKQAVALELPGTGPGRRVPRGILRPKVDARALAGQLLATGDKNPDMRKVARELALLDATGMETFVAEIRSSHLDSEAQGRFVIAMMATGLAERPQTALALFERFSAAGGKPDRVAASELVPPLLEKWAVLDPSATLQWLRSTGRSYPAAVSAEAKCKVLTVVALADPRRAFREMNDLGISEPQDAVRAIVRAGNTPQQRLSVIESLRGHLAGMTDERLKKEQSGAAMAEFAQSAVYGGASTARQWVAAARFTPAEMDAFATGIEKAAMRPEDIGGWIECLEEAGSETFAGQQVQEMVRRWTGQDYQAAGKWLTSTPDSPARQTAIRAYAETVAKYEPAVAEQWAITLPAGKDRDATLAKIHEMWPEDDSSGKSDFATRHGVR